MTTTLSMSEARRALEINFAAGLTVMFRGASGIGKTELALAYAEEQGEDYGLFELNCALASLPDVIGIMMPHKEKYIDADGSEQEITAAHFAYPYFMRDKRTGKPAFMFKRGMVVLEEYGQGQGDVKRALAGVMREKRAGEHLFPIQTDVLLLSNRVEDRSGVSKDYDFLINRRTELEVHADLEGWLIWAHGHDITNATMAYAARNTKLVFANKAPEKQGPWLTPRSLESADHFLKAAIAKGLDLDDPLVRVNLAGIIGEGYAHGYIAFAKIRDKLPSLQSILNDPQHAHLPKDELDQMMFLAFDLASKVKKETMKAIVTYVKRMPADFSFAFYRSSMKRDPALRSTKEFGDWAMENVGLLAAVNAA